MRRLYLRIYLAVVASLCVLVALVAIAWHWFGPHEFAPPQPMLRELVTDLLPYSADDRRLPEILQRWSTRLHADLTLYDSRRQLIGQAGAPIPADVREGGLHEWWAGRGFAIELRDGRRLAVQRRTDQLPYPSRGRMFHWSGWLGPLLLLAAAVGIGAYPVVRRLTRRLETLARAVDALGAGDLQTRVAVQGNDEVARLAAKFNASAQRIEQLVKSNRGLLANASHELRSPLARLRMAIELLGADDAGDAPAKRSIKQEIERNIAELDQLIEEILLASRLDAAGELNGGAGFERAPIELDALVGEACAQAAITPQMEPLRVAGEARLLRRLIRNLIDNALRHGGRPVSVELRRVGADAELSVLDRGPGVAPADRERIFEPFYRVRGVSEAGGGVGLGLALVRQIATVHGGQARCVARDDGPGSRFVVTLPLA